MKQAYQVMLTFHGRLFTPQFFGFMSVCLNIPNFVFVYMDYDFPKYDLGMLTSDSFLWNLI